MGKILVAICDDDCLVRDGLGAIVNAQDDMSLIGTAADGDEVVAICQKNRPDVVIMDIRMTGTDGVTATSRIKAHDPTIKVVILTTFHDSDYVRGAMACAVDGYLLKNSPTEVILEAVRTAHIGAATFQSEIAVTVGKMISNTSAPSNDSRLMELLSPREREILTIIAEGFSNKEIAAHLQLSEGTVRNYISKMFEKTGARDRTQLAILYYKGNRDSPGTDANARRI